MVDVRTNLLKNRRTLSEKDYQREKQILNKALIALGSVIVVVVGISIWNLIVTQKLSKIEDGLTQASKQMQGLVDASAKQVYLKARLQLVTKFLADRTVARESLEKVFSTAFAGVHVTAVGFVGTSAIEVTYISDNVAALSDLLKYYEADTGYFVQATSKGITRTKDGSYSIILVLKLPQGSK